MFEEDCEPETPNESCVDILDTYIKNCSWSESILKKSGPTEDEEETFSGGCHDIVEKGEPLELPPSSTRNLEYLRVWSNIRFKKTRQLQNEGPVTSSDIKKEDPEENQCIQDLKITKDSQVDERKNFIEEFMKNDFETDVLISSWNVNNNNVGLPIIEDGSKKFFRFYYLDAHERCYGSEASAYLFGKTFCPSSKCYKSCCVILYPLKRRIYVVPRHNIPDNTPENIKKWGTNMLKEFYNLALEPLKITEFECKFVKKKNSPGSFLSTEQLMLEVEYSACFPLVDKKLEGKTFSKIFNSSDSCLENFMLEKNIRGPCWLDVLYWKNPERLKTWCAFEITCYPHGITLCESLSKFISPPLTLFSFDMRNIDGKITVITWAANFNYEIWKENYRTIEKRSFCGFYLVDCNEQIHIPDLLRNLKRTKIEIVKSEEEILNLFLQKFYEIDPDILVVSDSHVNTLDKFVDRLDSLNIKDCDKLSRFKTISRINSKNILNGRLLCDLKLLSKEYSLSKSYELDYLYEKFLDIKNIDVLKDISLDLLHDEEKFPEVFITLTNNSLNLLRLASKISVIPLVFKLTEICGNILNQTLKGGITKRSEYLLSHAFYQKNFILPGRPCRKKSEHAEINELPLSGGLVLEPLLGLYENYVLLMDFQSLYPCIIKEFNLCISRTEFDESTAAVTVLPKLMSHLIEMRQKVKDEMKNFQKGSETYFIHKIYETALKLSANSVYGCLACKHFRFYSPKLAQDITEKAREVLQSTVKILRDQGFKIIYGDTDSIMVDTDSKDLIKVRKIGNDISKMINSHYNSLNLKIDAVFKKLLLVNKKKYAGIVLDEQNEETVIFKGLNVVRYDWPEYVSKIGKNVVQIIFSDNDLPKKRCTMKTLIDKTKRELLNGHVPMEFLIMTKYLQQDPSSYRSTCNLLHVQVALRCREKNLINFKNGDAVPFIVCTNKNKVLQKAFHPIELNSVDGWVIDGSYYYHKLVYPFASGICSLINIELDEGINKDSKKDSKMECSKEVEFDRRDSFEFCCKKCQKIILFDEGQLKQFFERCSNSNCDYLVLNDPIYLRNTLVLTINSYIKKYYKFELKCSNIKCSYTTLRIPVKYKKNKYECPFCLKGVLIQAYSDMDLFLQLQYFRFIFKYGLVIFEKEDNKKDVFKSLLDIVEKYVDKSKFLRVDLEELFELFS